MGKEKSSISYIETENADFLIVIQGDRKTMLDYMLNFFNISYVRCLHVSLIINTFAAVVGLYIRDGFNNITLLLFVTDWNLKIYTDSKAPKEYLPGTKSHYIILIWY